MQVVAGESARDRNTEPETGNGSESSWLRRREKVVVDIAASLLHLHHKDRLEVEEELGVVWGINDSLIRGSILQPDQGHGENKTRGVTYFDASYWRFFGGLNMREDYCCSW
jgi:hypothetical protein